MWSPAGKLLAGIALGGSGPIGSALRLTGLFEVDPTGQQPAMRVLADSSGINAFCIAPDGFIYGPALTRLVRIHLESGAIETLGEGFGFLGAVRYNALDQALYLLDVAPPDNPQAPALYRTSLDGQDQELFARLSAQPEATLAAADNFVIADDGTLYVTRFLRPVITRVSADGSRIDDINVGER